MSNFLNSVKSIAAVPDNKLDVIMGFPGSGKTTLASTYPKPMLYVQIGDDGGGIVMKDVSDVDYLKLDTDNDGAIYTKIIGLFDELLSIKGGKYKTIVIDAYSSIEEIMIKVATKSKGQKLSWDERGQISQAMITIRDKIVNASQVTPLRIVEITHLKKTENTDNITGETDIRYIPKMTETNGNIMLERANNVMYCSRKACLDSNGKPTVKFLTYIGAHPNIDTKLRYKSKSIAEDKGIYVENCTYDKITALLNGDLQDSKITIISQKEDDEKTKNPFEEGTI